MLRGIAAVVVGYVVIVAFVLITFAIAWLALGRSFAFAEGTTDVTLGWIVLALLLSFIGASLGGVVARGIAPGHSRTSVEVLAGLVLIVGFLSAVAAQRRNTQSEPLTPHELAEIGVFEAATKARQPAWFSFFVPFVGALGVRWGGRARHRRNPSRA